MQLADGASLSEIAEAEGVDYTSVSSAVLAAAQADVDAAVDAGKMRPDRTDRTIERVERWLDGGGNPREPPGRD